MGGSFFRKLFALFAITVSAIAAGAPGQPKYILDTDAGADIDDAYALALFVAEPNIDILGVTTGHGPANKRAQLVGKILEAFGRGDIEVHSGRDSGGAITDQYTWAQYYRSPRVHFGDAVNFMRDQVERYPGEITLIGIGPLTNIGDFISRYPDSVRKVKELVIMGGAVYTGYAENSNPVPEYNIAMDIGAARKVYSSGIPLTMAGLEVTTMMKLEQPLQKRLYTIGSRGTDALAGLTSIWGPGIPTLYDPMAVAYGLGHRFCDHEKQHIEVDGKGVTRITPGEPNVTVLVRPQRDPFMGWYVNTVAALFERTK